MEEAKVDLNHLVKTKQAPWVNSPRCASRSIVIARADLFPCGPSGIRTLAVTLFFFTSRRTVHVVRCSQLSLRT